MKEFYPNDECEDEDCQRGSAGDPFEKEEWEEEGVPI
jgi:hypothetical protein